MAADCTFLPAIIVSANGVFLTLNSAMFALFSNKIRGHVYKKTDRRDINKTRKSSAELFFFRRLLLFRNYESLCSLDICNGENNKTTDHCIFIL